MATPPEMGRCLGSKGGDARRYLRHFVVRTEASRVRSEAVVKDFAPSVHGVIPMRHGLYALVASAILVASTMPPARAADDSQNPSVAFGAWPNGHDTVPTYVNGAGPYPFILDTGADGTAVYEWFAGQSKLPKAGQDQDLTGQTGSAKVAMYRVDSLSVGGLHFRNAEAFGLPNRKDSGGQAGVIGNDFMDKAVVVFDFPCRQVTVYPRPLDATSLVTSKTPMIHAGLDKGTSLLTIPASVNGVQGIAVIDSGSRSTRLTPSFASKAGIDISAASFHDDEAIYGTSMVKRVPRTGPVGEVRFAGLALPDTIAQVVDLPVLAGDFHGAPAMLLGVDLLGRYRMVYDHAARNVWFDASRCPAR